MLMILHWFSTLCIRGRGYRTLKSGFILTRVSFQKSFTVHPVEPLYE